jgi:hypothetical protein
MRIEIHLSTTSFLKEGEKNLLRTTPLILIFSYLVNIHQSTHANKATPPKLHPTKPQQHNMHRQK